MSSEQRTILTLRVTTVVLALLSVFAYMTAYQSAQPDVVDVLLYDAQGPKATDVDTILLSSPSSIILIVLTSLSMVAWLVMAGRQTQTPDDRIASAGDEPETPS